MDRDKIAPGPDGKLDLEAEKIRWMPQVFIRKAMGLLKSLLKDLVTQRKILKKAV